MANSESFAQTPVAMPFNTRLVVAGTLLVGFAILILARTWTNFAPDLSALFMAGHLYATGQYDLIYAAPPGFFVVSPDEWSPLLPALGLAGQDVLAFVYPPLWAAIMAPFTHFGPQAFFQAFAVVELAMMVGSVLLAWRLCRAFAIPLWAWILLSMALMAPSLIIFTALTHLQPQIIVVFLIFLTFERYNAGHVATAGIILACAAMVKLAPAGLVLIFLLDRNWRALASFTAACAAFAIASFAIIGADLHLDFLASMAHASEGVFVSTINYSFEVLLHALLGQVDVNATTTTLADTANIPLISKMILLAAILWMVVRTNRLPHTHQLAARVFLTTLLISLFGPLSWSHYFLPQVFLLPALIGLLDRRYAILILLGFTIATSWAMLLFLKSLFPGDFANAALSAATMTALFCLVAAKVKG